LPCPPFTTNTIENAKVSDKKEKISETIITPVSDSNMIKLKIPSLIYGKVTKFEPVREI
jgi:hypothetical protein